MKTDNEILFEDPALLTSEELLRRRALIAKQMEAYRTREWNQADEDFMDLVVACIEADRATKH